MPPLTGFSATTITESVTGAGVLYYTPSSTPVLMGATVGGITVEPNPSYRQMKADGVRQPLVGMREAPTFAPVLKGKLLLLSETLINKILMPGSTSAAGSAGEGNVVTPKAIGAMLVDADYIPNVRFVIDKTDPAAVKWAEFHFPRMICTRWSFAGMEGDYPTVDFEFAAEQLNASTPISNVKPARTALPV